MTNLVWAVALVAVIAGAVWLYRHWRMPTPGAGDYGDRFGDNKDNKDSNDV